MNVSGDMAYGVPAMARSARKSRSSIGRTAAGSRVPGPGAHSTALEPLADEIFELTTLSWRARTRGRTTGRSNRALDLAETEFLSLDLLAKKEPRTVGEIQRAIGVLPAQMSRVIRSLEAKHGKPLIDCSINPEDKRRIDVRRTEAGVKAHAAYRASRLMATVAILGELTQKDRNEFMRLLRMIRGHLAKQLS